MDDATYEQLKKRIGQLLDLDLDAYKQRQMRRRIETFVGRNSTDPLAFIESLRTDKDLLRELRDMLTINVTEFFRDAPQWQLLRDQILPELMKGSNRLSIWSAGCSTGDEPYSVAMTLDRLGRRTTSTILATDFDRDVLVKAQAGGPYVQSALKNVSAEDREAYFDATETGGFKVKDNIRRGVQFRELNLLKDRFGERYDLILCRNVTIYFDQPIKEALTQRFRAALKPGGYLFIGATEALLGAEGEGFKRTTGNFYRNEGTGTLARAA
ncbi:MAG: protein-glutamate O-methyltransferase CheR [Dehalococcoidia bacterium]